MGTKKRKVWVSLYRYEKNADFLVRTKSDRIRAWWIEQYETWDWDNPDSDEKVKRIRYALNEEDDIWKDRSLYKTSWLSLLVAKGISKKQVLDCLRGQLEGDTFKRVMFIVE
jgi:hypothetical protein